MKTNLFYVLSFASVLGCITRIFAQSSPQILFTPAPQLSSGLDNCGLFDFKFFTDHYNYVNLTFHDWDKNGLKDLFFGNNNGTITYYSNVGTAAEPCFKWITDNFAQILIPEGNAAPCFKDFDGDGKADLLLGCGRTASTGGWVSLFINTGSVEMPAFALKIPKIGNMDLSDNSVPFAYDINKDGIIDVYIGEGYGRWYYLQNTGKSTEPKFDSTEVMFGKFPWQSTLQVLNLMGDSKPELVVTESYGSMTPLAYNGSPIKWTNTNPNPFEGLDLCFHTGGCFSRAAMVDINNDSLPDVFAMMYNESGKFFQFFLNKGTETKPLYDFKTPKPLSIYSTSFPAAFADLDKDGFREVYLSRADGKIVVMENQSKSAMPNWQKIDDDFLHLTTSNPKSIAFGHLNKDTFVDLALGSVTTKSLQIYLSDGKGNFVVASTPSLDNFPFYANTIVEIADFYRDSIPDLIVCSSESVKHFVSNDRSGTFWELTPKPLLASSAVKITIGDIDGDKIEDALAGRYYLSVPTIIKNTQTDVSPNFLVQGNNLSGPIGQYPTLTHFPGYCGPVLFIDGQFYVFSGIKPAINSTSLVLCANETHPLNAKPDLGLWGYPVSPAGVLLPATGAGTYAATYTYLDGFGCYALVDTVWLYVKSAPNATILKLNEAKIKTDTINVCKSIGQQRLGVGETGGSFTVMGTNYYIDSNGGFTPGTWQNGVFSVVYCKSDNGCRACDTIRMRIQNCTVDTENANSAVSRFAISPNPFSSLANISFALAQREAISLMIIDVYGRGLKTFPEAEMSTEGEHQFQWDGLDDAGNMLPTGLYWVQLKVTQKGLVQTLPLVKLD